MGFFSKKSKNPTEQRKKEHDKAVNKAMSEQEAKQVLNHRKNECRIMLSDSEAYFKQVMNKEVKNARTAQSLGIDCTLNKNHFSDAMRGIECVQRARWYLDTISTDEGLQGALRLLNQALKTMDKLDGGVTVVNPASLRRKVDHLYELENMEEDDTVLDPTKDFKYKFENGLFENMVAGMSYEEAKLASNQDLTPGGTQPAATGVPNFGAIFDNSVASVDDEERRRRAELMRNRGNET